MLTEINQAAGTGATLGGETGTGAGRGEGLPPLGIESKKPPASNGGKI